MDAVLGVDLEARLAGIDAHHLIDPRRAVALRRLGIFRQVDVDRNARVLELQVDRLVFLVIGVGDEHRTELVEAQHPVILRIADRLALGRRLQRMGVGLAMLQAAGAADQAEPAQEVGRGHFQAAEQRAEIGAETAHQRLDVAYQLELFRHIGMLIGRLIAFEHLRGLARADRLIGCVRREYPRLHGIVRALDARHIDEAGRATDQGAAREDQARHRLEAAFVDGAGTVGDAGAAFEVLGDHRVVL